VSRVCASRFTFYFLQKKGKAEIVKSPKMGKRKIRKFAKVLYVRYTVFYSLHRAVASMPDDAQPIFYFIYLLSHLPSSSSLRSER
jgi:hypothetical protein